MRWSDKHAPHAESRFADDDYIVFYKDLSLKKDADDRKERQRLKRLRKKEHPELSSSSDDEDEEDDEIKLEKASHVHEIERDTKRSKRRWEEEERE